MNNLDVIEQIEQELQPRFKEADRIACINQKKVLDAFRVTTLAEQTRMKI